MVKEPISDHILFCITPRVATHLVYKYFAKSTDLCGDSPQQQHSRRTTIRTTVLIRPLQFRYVQFVPLQYRYDMNTQTQTQIRKDNIARLTCLITYSHELQLYRFPTEPKTTLYIVVAKLLFSVPQNSISKPRESR